MVLCCYLYIQLVLFFCDCRLTNFNLFMFCFSAFDSLLELNLSNQAMLVYSNLVSELCAKALKSKRELVYID